MQYEVVDIEKAQTMLDIVREWGQQPNIAPELIKATEAAKNSLMGLMLTGIQEGFFNNTAEFNEAILRKLTIAFNMGYYAREMKGEATP